MNSSYKLPDPQRQISDEIAQLTSTLFPKHFSHVWELA